MPASYITSAPSSAVVGADSAAELLSRCRLIQPARTVVLSLRPSASASLTHIAAPPARSPAFPPVAREPDGRKQRRVRPSESRATMVPADPNHFVLPLELFMSGINNICVSSRLLVLQSNEDIYNDRRHPSHSAMIASQQDPLNGEEWYYEARTCLIVVSSGSPDEEITETF